MATDSYIQVAVDSTGKKVQNYQNTVSGNVVYAQGVALVDPLGAPLDIDASGSLHVHIAEPTTAFGEVSVSHNTPVVQLDFVYGLNTNVCATSVTGSGTVTTANQLVSANTTANASSSATVSSKRYAKYRAGQGVSSRFTAIFTTGAANSKQYAGAGTTTLTEGFFFGYNGTAFGICHTRASANTATNLNQPSLNIVYKAINTSNTSAITVKGASAAMFIEGTRAHLGPRYGTDNSKTAVTTLTNILTLRNATTLNGVANRSQVRFRALTFGGNVTAHAAGMATLRLYLNTTLGGSPSYAAIDGTTADAGVTITSGQSAVSVDTAGTTITGGTLIFSAICPVDTGQQVDVTALEIFLNPGDTLTFAMSAGTSATAGVAISWSEDI